MPSPRPRRLLAVVVLTGLVGGAAGGAYLGLLEVSSDLLGPDRWTPMAHLVVLVVVGVAIAVLTRWLGRTADVELLVDDIHVAGGVDSLVQLRSLLPVSLLCVGAGGALGPEAPLVTTTGSLGSWLGARADLDRRERRIVSITGMAAGFAVLFGAPLGSAVFALEILHRRGLEYYEALVPAAIGALCGYVISIGTTGLGLVPLFAFPTLAPLGAGDLGWAVAAGVVGAGIAVAFTRLCTGLPRLLHRAPGWARPVMGGVALGGLALVTPFALTNGEHQIVELNASTTVAATTLLVAAAVKLVASAVSVASGWKGGFIVPLFFVGYCLARASTGLLPGADPWILAAGAMAAANVGVTKTPFGSTLVITEMAGTAVLPSTLIASMVSFALTSGVGLIASQRHRFDPTVDDPAPLAAG